MNYAMKKKTKQTYLSDETQRDPKYFSDAQRKIANERWLFQFYLCWLMSKVWVTSAHAVIDTKLSSYSFTNDV